MLIAVWQGTGTSCSACSHSVLRVITQTAYDAYQERLCRYVSPVYAWALPSYRLSTPL
jgi:hypothetical protein